MLSFRVLGASFSRFGCSVFEFWVLRFRDLGASFSRFGCFMLRSSFSSASFSKLPVKVLDFAPFRGSYVREFELSHSKLVNRIIKITLAHN